MTRLSRLPPRDLEALSAYADGRLTPSEQKALEARLSGDPNLRRALGEIRATTTLLRGLPSVRPPRAFTLTPEMVGVRRRWAGYPALQLATAMATFAFIVVVGLDLFSLTVAPTEMRAAAPAQELALEAPAAQPGAPSEAAAGAMQEAVASTEVVATPTLEAGVQMDAVSTPPPAATATPPLTPSDFANRAVPTLGAAGEAAVPTAEGTALPPAAEPGILTAPACEACSGDQLLPPETPSLKAAGEQTTREAGAATGLGEEAPTPEAFALEAPPAPQAEYEAPTDNGPVLRWLEILLAAAALILGGLTLWARRTAR